MIYKFPASTYFLPDAFLSVARMFISIVRNTDQQHFNFRGLEKILRWKWAVDQEKWLFFCKQQRKQVYGTIYPADAEEVYKAGWDREKYYSSYVSPFFCNSPTRRRCWYSLYTANARSQFNNYNPDLYSYKHQQTKRYPYSETSKK